MEKVFAALILVALVRIPFWLGRGKRVTKDKWNRIKDSYDNGANGVDNFHSSSDDSGHSADSSH